MSFPARVVGFIALTVVLGACLAALAGADEPITIKVPQKARVQFTNGRVFTGTLVSVGEKDIEFQFAGKPNAIKYKLESVKAIETTDDVYTYDAARGRFESAKAKAAKEGPGAPDEKKPANKKPGLGRKDRGISTEIPSAEQVRTDAVAVLRGILADLPKTLDVFVQPPEERLYDAEEGTLRIRVLSQVDLEAYALVWKRLQAVLAVLKPEQETLTLEAMRSGATATSPFVTPGNTLRPRRLVAGEGWLLWLMSETDLVGAKTKWDVYQMPVNLAEALKALDVQPYLVVTAVDGEGKPLAEQEISLEPAKDRYYREQWHKWGWSRLRPGALYVAPLGMSPAGLQGGSLNYEGALVRQDFFKIDAAAFRRMAELRSTLRLRPFASP